MRAFLPDADIFESEDPLTVVLEMPGVDRNNVDVSVENGVLTVEGGIDFFGFRARSIRTRSVPRCETA
jgi:HSP20 family protein